MAIVGALRTPREKWVEAGLQALAAGGLEAVRVEALAKTLGVTKGGFYGYFADRAALLQAILDAWERETVDEVLDRVEAETADVLDRARLAGRLTFTSDRLLPLDLAVRAWAQRDSGVAERVRKVDNRRMQVLRDAISTIRQDPDEVEAWCLLAFCMAIGNNFLAADHPGRSREEVMKRASDLILSPSQDRRQN